MYVYSKMKFKDIKFLHILIGLTFVLIVILFVKAFTSKKVVLEKPYDLNKEKTYYNQLDTESNENAPFAGPGCLRSNKNYLNNNTSYQNITNNPSEHNSDNINYQMNLQKLTVAKKNIYNIIPNIIKESIIIIILFVILSVPYVKDTIGTYVKQININKDGKVPLLGMVTYGFILAVLVLITKQIVIKK